MKNFSVDRVYNFQWNLFPIESQSVWQKCSNRNITELIESRATLPLIIIDDVIALTNCHRVGVMMMMMKDWAIQWVIGSFCGWFMNREKFWREILVKEIKNGLGWFWDFWVRLSKLFGLGFIRENCGQRACCVGFKGM